MTVYTSIYCGVLAHVLLDRRYVQQIYGIPPNNSITSISRLSNRASYPVTSFHYFMGIQQPYVWPVRDSNWSHVNKPAISHLFVVLKTEFMSETVQCTVMWLRIALLTLAYIFMPFQIDVLSLLMA